MKKPFLEKLHNATVSPRTRELLCIKGELIDIYERLLDVSYTLQDNCEGEITDTISNAAEAGNKAVNDLIIASIDNYAQTVEGTEI